MAEAFGIATAAVGLLPLCRDGFQLVREVVGASDSFKEVSLRVQSQINVFEEWRRSWKLEKDEWGKFKEYSKENQCGARAIGHELALLSFTLCNASKLLNTYGLKLKDSHRHESVRPTEIQNPDTEKLLSSEASFNEWVKGCKMNLPFIKKCKFVLTSDKSNAEDLVDHLRERNEALYRLSPSATQVIQIQNIYYIIGKTSSDEQVEALRKEEERAKKSGQQSLPYEEFRHIAAFSNAVKEVKEKKRIRDPQRFELSQFHTSPDYEVSASQAAEMGLLKGFPNRNEMRVVYIEWMSGGGEVEREVKAKAKARMLSITMSEQVLLPNCYGLLEDGAGRTKRFGLVLAPPDHIRRNAKNMMPGSISRRRKPKSLRTILLEAGDTKEDLGIRFNLAKKLVNAVHKMHCADWVHKNIRPGSILFFPTSSEVLSSKISSTPQLDYSKPFLVGFGQARVDDTEVWNEYSQRTRAPGEITLDEYQHPKKIEDPSMKYSRFFDVYSVGCVLLEIGMWLPLAELVDIQRHGEPVEAKRTRNDIQAKAKALTGITGSVYAGVVKKCLDADPQNHLSEEENKDACAALLSELIGELNRCSA